jgi:predicted Zn-dependent peptidase
MKLDLRARVILRSVSLAIIIASFSAILVPVRGFSQSKYTYSTFKNDPLKTRVYTLKNGLTVILTDYKDEPRLQTFIAVRTGSKNDPEDATGLAHYLEHLLFKGTDKYGTLDWSKEKPILDEIETEYEVYRETRDSATRALMYHIIDSTSNAASHFAIANEYDKMVSALGARGTNAFTWVDQTVYVNDIPANQLHKWLTLESERFRNPVIRLFHTELEAVYEEKNRHLDNDDAEVEERMMEGLFPGHSYGTQTTIGTVEHLKNPSIKKIKQYLHAHYVPNNMAIIMSGDLDFDKTIQWIDESFGQLPTASNPQSYADRTFPAIEPKKEPTIVEVKGPQGEQVAVAYRLPGMSNADIKYLRVLDGMLDNGVAGLINLDLNQQQKTLEAGAGFQGMADYSYEQLYAKPKEGQTLEQVRALLLAEIDKLKKGNYDDKLISSVINDLTMRRLQMYESNGGRAGDLMDAYTGKENLQEHFNMHSDIQSVTKAKLTEIAKKYFTNDYVVVYKRIGDRNSPKVVKPAITPVEMNRDAVSPFAANIMSTSADKLTPKFIDYNTDIQHSATSNGIKVHAVRNDENDLFTLSYAFRMGKRQDKELAFALDYLPFLGTETMTPEQLKRKLFSLGAKFSVSASTENMRLTLTGLNKNFNESVKLFEDLLAHPKANDEALAELVDRVIKDRDDQKKDKETILRAMNQWGEHGSHNSFNDVLTTEQLKTLKAKELVEKLKSLPQYEHQVFYYGPAALKDVVATMNAEHVHGQSALTPLPVVADYSIEATQQNRVFVVNYPMQQAEIEMFSKSVNYDPKLEPVLGMYNEYFGGSMASILFQEIRESRALAYATWSHFISPDRVGKPYYNFAYIGTQADKLPEAMKTMFSLFENLPSNPGLYEQSMKSVREQIESERLTKQALFWNYESAELHGLDHDLRRDIYEQLPSITLEKVQQFQQERVKGQHYNILVLGDESKLDKPTLGKYGPIQNLTLTELFGY